MTKTETATEKPRARRTRKTAKTENLTIVSALEALLKAIQKSELIETTFDKVKAELDFLKEKTGLTPMQLSAIAMLIDSGRPLSYRNFSCYMGCSRLRVMAYSEEIEELEKMGWTENRRLHDESEGFALVPGVVKALSKNKTFVPEKISGLPEKDYYLMLHRHIERGKRGVEYNFCDEARWCVRLTQANPQMEICRLMNAITTDDYDKFLFLMIVDDYIEFHDSEDEGLLHSTVENDFDDEEECGPVSIMLASGYHMVQQLGYVEYKCDDGMTDDSRYLLSRKVKDALFSGKRNLLRKQRNRNNRNADLTSCKKIKEKHLFYNVEEQRQVDQLASLLSKEKLPEIQQRLENEGMRKGFACLLYGGPGTGKTETALQIARMTGRDIMQVEIAGMKDKWVGESEKNIKKVFADYRDICEAKKDNIPILFFNEADAIIGKRTDHADSSVDKMDNAMQNIILQEIENLDGILIATTNLTSNMDEAFERRFLYKIEFHKPDTDVKAKIWSSMISDLSDEDARTLASRYDFSGGQIENVARKKTIDYILNGTSTSIDNLDSYCRDEQLAQKTKPKHIAGFGA